MSLQVLDSRPGIWLVVDIPFAYIKQHELNKWLPEYREFMMTYKGPHITLEHYIRWRHWDELDENKKN
jgi:hypothetical protein